MCGSRKYPYPHQTEGHWKFQGEGGLKRPKFLKESMSPNWNFQQGGEFRPKKPFVGGGNEYGYFLEQHNSSHGTK